MTEPALPPVAPVRVVLDALAARGAEAAVGGSGLLAALGLGSVVHDWDVTTEAPAEVVRSALGDTGLTFRPDTVRDGPYATRERFAVDEGPVDVLVGFAIRTATGVEALPTRVTGHWRGLPLADPAVWARAYRLLGRTAKADLLDEWLRANPDRAR
ncbi:hypothetical protein [Amycolatopsis anabasis]|uniref:hypothetical protein n=1 Tax=Amycolatopsis anabasis TaxID=1840409 RepID=UPI00131B9343|nr:hypothetical protein [Amycolatopsis anabasis]